MQDFIRQEIKASLAAKEAVLKDENMLQIIERVAQHSIDSLNRGRKILVAGNGGSAADAQHIAGELVSRFYYDRPALPAIALTVDTSILTAIGNDYGYEDVFSRQLEALAQEGDVFLAISTSGNSKNILKAIKVAKERRIKVVGLTGQNGGEMKAMCDEIIMVPSSVTPRIQECHILIGHIICALIEAKIFPKDRK